MTFDDWVVAQANAISDARAVSVADVGADPGEVALQLQKSRQHFVAVAELKADATSWVNKTYAAALESARKAGLRSADERRAAAEADATYNRALEIQAKLAATLRALDKLHFEILNDRRTSFPTSRGLGT